MVWWVGGLGLGIDCQLIRWFEIKVSRLYLLRSSLSLAQQPLSSMLLRTKDFTDEVVQMLPQL